MREKRKSFKKVSIGSAFRKIIQVNYISKRQKFLIAVVLLSFGLFFSEHQLGKSGIFVVIGLSILTDVLLLWSNYKDIRENLSLYLFVLPFFYSLSFGLFYFLVPARYLTRIIITSIYAVGLYSLFLAQNIFIVASIRTIALLASARIVSFVISLVSYFFLSNVVVSLDLPIFITALLVFGYSFFLSAQALWTISLEKNPLAYLLWISFLSLCLGQTALILQFFPSSPTVISLFLTGLFYSIIGLSQVWMEKRLFRGVLWGYVWVFVIVVLVFVIFTPWGV